VSGDRPDREGSTDGAVREHNRAAWNRAAETDYGRYATGVGPEPIAAARRGDLRFSLTDARPVPRDWLPADLGGLDALCLASGGGQQGPLLAAAGATVTVLDLSPGQLALDRAVAEREGLTLRIVEGDMRDLSSFPDASFDLIVHPISNCFVPEVRPIWHEGFRVLRPGGLLLAAFMNPDLFMVDLERFDATGEVAVTHPRPYREIDTLSPEALAARREAAEPIHFGHSLEAQIGGQLDAGFVLTGLYEDVYERGDPLDAYLPPFFATRAQKP
jgi:SAM-dependent methyltransferase